jgi:hypothetical protein
MSISVARWWLAILLILIPFHHRIYKVITDLNHLLASLFNLVDEITLIIFLPLALLLHLRNQGHRNPIYLLLLSSLSAVIAVCLISGMINRNPPLITLYGTFDYIKFFIFIIIYSAIFKEYLQFQRVFRVLLAVAILIGLVAIIQELWALTGRYILGKGILDTSVYLLAPPPLTEGQAREVWESGIYSSPSLLSHRNLLGLYSLFILTVYVYTDREPKKVVLLPLLSGVLLSVSRVSYAGLLLLIGVEVLRGRRRLIVLSLPLLILFGVMAFREDTVIHTQVEHLPSLYQRAHFREYAMEKAIEVWQDHPVWGAGPGMFGGAVAFKTVSPLYEEYNFMLVMEMIHSLDQLWPQVLAETGVMGFVVLAGVFILLLMVFTGLHRLAPDGPPKALSSALMLLTLMLLIYTLGGNLNNVSIMLTYGAFAGVTLGCFNSETATKSAGGRLPLLLSLSYLFIFTIGLIVTWLYPVNRCIEGDCLGGYGVYEYNSGAVYRGQWREGRRDGYGEWTLSDGAVYKGQWREGRMDGYGLRRYPDGSEYTGQWSNGHKDGYGRLGYANGVELMGQWRRGRFSGYGIMVYDNKLRYEGQWRDGEIDGYGRMNVSNSFIYEGTWKNGRMHGWGVMTLPDGRRRVGRWKNNRLVTDVQQGP